MSYKSNSSHQEESQDLEIGTIPKLIFQASEESLGTTSQKEFVRVAKTKKQQICTQQILKLYQVNQRKQDQEIRDSFKKPHKKVHQVFNKTAKKHTIFDNQSLENIKILQDLTIKYKEYLYDNSNSKVSDYKLQLFKLLIVGIFELRAIYNNSLTRQSLTLKQKDIAQPKTDLLQWIKIVCQDFDDTFTNAQNTLSYFNANRKWNNLIKNCQDQSNSDLRRKIITRSIKAKTIIQKPDEFLLSNEAKLQIQRRERLILAEAGKDFDKVSIEESNHPSDEEQEFPIMSTQEILKPTNSTIDKKNLQQREKIKQYRFFLDNEFINRMKTRIEQDLATNNSSYALIMNDFKSKFESKIQ